MTVTVDLHTHILPMVDDGAETIEESMEMMSIAVRNGTDEIVLTPHYLTRDMRSLGLPIDKIRSVFDEIKKLAAVKFPQLKLHFGAEMFGVSNIEDYIEEDKIVTIGTSQYVLTEFGFDDNPSRALDVTKAVIGAGYSVIIAHPERYEFIKANPRLIVPFLEAGALLQINAISLLGENGHLSYDVALSFLENNLAAFVASDCHSLFQRSPDLSEAYSFVSSNFSQIYADDLFCNNPKSVIDGKRI